MKRPGAFLQRLSEALVAFTPKGGCPLKPVSVRCTNLVYWLQKVAFTPKGGCPLKLRVDTASGSPILP